ncbi:hypothetical protein [Hymenobacter fodinae]|uniref:Phage portal protein n=1 Tax=Hymenobacter fodinae TaxID=2510796 RepID=A0A4Z0P997_9BACT|nr:hypothetical protein [Hymenobacter fodinae]TGE08749.1 hypothetical protein EU556_13770 [Hymenobacter fodinae]
MAAPQGKAPRSTKPRTATVVRGFMNLAPATLPPGIKAQKDAGIGSLGGKGIAFGEGNHVPQIALAAAQDSGACYRALEKRSAFLEGMGFPVPIKDPNHPDFKKELLGTMGDTPVPGQPGKTVNDLWAEECSSGGYFNGAAFLVKYNTEGGKGETYLLPFQSVRKTDKGTFLLNHKFGKKGFNAGETTEHLPFDDSEEVVKGILERAAMPVDEKNPEGPKIGQPGQILYAYIPKAGEMDYPLPPHWPGLEDVLADAEYSRFDYEEVRNGFFPNGALVMVGEEDEATEDEEGKTEAERTDDELKEFTGNGTNPLGRKKLVVLSAKSKEQVPVWVPITGTNNMAALITKREAMGELVCRNIGIPPILCGFAKAGQLGAAREILNAVELTQDDLSPLQRCLLRALFRLFPEVSHLSVGNRKPISFVPEEVLAKLTTDEIRALADYGPATAATNKVLENLQTLSPIVAAKVLSSMSAEQILALVGLTPDGNPPVGGAEPATPAA